MGFYNDIALSETRTTDDDWYDRQDYGRNTTMQMSSYDRWITQGPPDYDEEPELTGLAGEAQALVDALDDALDMPCPDDRDPNIGAIVAYHARLSIARDRAAARLERRIQADRADLNAQVADYYGYDDSDDLPF